MISSIAAITQVISQALELWQQIDQTRQAVRMAPKVLSDTKTQLANLADIIDDVERDTSLRTFKIFKQLNIIDSIATELNKILLSMAVLQRKSTLRQSLHAFIRRSRDEASLNDVLMRLEKAKAELAIRINVAHVGITRGIAEHMGISNKPEQLHHLHLERNESGQDSIQMNGILGFDSPKLGIRVNVTENKAQGKSRQTNIVSRQMPITSHGYIWDARDLPGYTHSPKRSLAWDGIKI